MKSYRQMYREAHGRDVWEDIPQVLLIAIGIGLYYLYRWLF